MGKLVIGQKFKFNRKNYTVISEFTDYDSHFGEETYWVCKYVNSDEIAEYHIIGYDEEYGGIYRHV